MLRGGAYLVSDLLGGLTAIQCAKCGRTSPRAAKPNRAIRCTPRRRSSDCVPVEQQRFSYGPQRPEFRESWLAEMFPGMSMAPAWPRVRSAILVLMQIGDQLDMNRIISLRKANTREIDRYEAQIDSTDES